MLDTGLSDVLKSRLGIGQIEDSKPTASVIIAFIVFIAAHNFENKGANHCASKRLRKQTRFTVAIGNKSLHIVPSNMV